MLLRESGVLVNPVSSLQRTYQYLRVTLVGTVVVIFVSVAVAIPVVGWLPSISHYFYSPARNGFVGALVAASLALFALSGRRVEAVLLDAAALLAPLIAIVPTAIAAGSVPGMTTGCPEPCVPHSLWADIDNGVATYLIVGVLATVTLAVWGFASTRTLAPGLWIAVGVLAVVGVTWGLFFDVFLAYAHVVAATLFFVLIAVVALINAFAPPEPGAAPAGRMLKIAYTAIAVLLAADLIALAVLVTVRFDGSGVLVGETIALLLFAVFWVLQTAQKWRQPDPALVGGA